MLTHVTIDKLKDLKLFAIAEALERQRASSQYAAMDFEERLGLLVDVECTARAQRALTRRLKQAHVRYPASLEDLDYEKPRGLNRPVMLALATGAWIGTHENVVVIGPTGVGKSYIASACVESACRRGFAALYLRVPRLLHDLAVSRGDGSYTRLLARLAKIDLLALDDWLLAPLADSERRDLLEVIEDRSERASTLIASQLPTDAWHQAIGEPTLADAIRDRLLQCAHRIELTGPSIRNPHPTSSAEAEAGQEDRKARSPSRRR
jgi:DNA replication protein DnaC